MSDRSHLNRRAKTTDTTHKLGATLDSRCSLAQSDSLRSKRTNTTKITRSTSEAKMASKTVDFRKNHNTIEPFDLEQFKVMSNVTIEEASQWRSELTIKKTNNTISDDEEIVLQKLTDQILNFYIKQVDELKTAETRLTEAQQLVAEHEVTIAKMTSERDDLLAKSNNVASVPVVDDWDMTNMVSGPVVSQPQVIDKPTVVETTGQQQEMIPTTVANLKSNVKFSIEEVLRYRSTIGIFDPKTESFADFVSQAQQLLLSADVPDQVWSRVLVCTLSTEAHNYFSIQELNDMRRSINYEYVKKKMMNRFLGTGATEALRVEAELFEQRRLPVERYMAEKRSRIYKWSQTEPEANVCRMILKNMNEDIKSRIRDIHPGVDWTIESLNDTAIRIQSDLKERAAIKADGHKTGGQQQNHQFKHEQRSHGRGRGRWFGSAYGNRVFRSNQWQPDHASHQQNNQQLDSSTHGDNSALGQNQRSKNQWTPQWQRGGFYNRGSPGGCGRPWRQSFSTKPFVQSPRSNNDVATTGQQTNQQQSQQVGQVDRYRPYMTPIEYQPSPTNFNQALN